MNSKNYPPYFLFSVIEHGLPNFLSRYLQTINIAFEDIERMKIKIPTDDRVIYLIDKSMQAMDENQERIENQIIELQKIKNFFLQKMFPDTQTNK
ncbi:restriction endonuclease subunit S domain-containing protein [Parasutterella excrementihominis]